MRAPFLHRLPIISRGFPTVSTTEIVTETHCVVPAESQVQRGIGCTAPPLLPEDSPTAFTAEIVVGMPHVISAESQVLRRIECRLNIRNRIPRPQCLGWLRQKWLRDMHRSPRVASVAFRLSFSRLVVKLHSWRFMRYSLSSGGLASSQPTWRGVSVSLGDRQDSSSYRGVTLLSVPGRRGSS